MPIPAYRAKQSTDTTGTGTIVLNAAGTNARSFAAAYGASSRRVMYAISWSSGFEIGYGDFDGGTPGSLTRNTCLASSNAGSFSTLPAGTKDVFAVFDPGAREVLTIFGTTTLALADLGNAVLFTGASAASLNLPAIATAPLGSGWMVRNAGTAALTIDPNGAETINGAATLVLQAGQAAFVLDGGAAWECIIAGGTTIGAALLAAVNSAAVADLAISAPVEILSAATTNIGASASPNVRITGGFTIFSFGTIAVGTRRFLAFAGALILTHNATSLILPGVANITTAANDTAVARSLGSGNWIIESYTRAATLPITEMATANVVGRVAAGSGPIGLIPLGNAAAALSLGINRGAEQGTTSGVQIDFTGIPAGVRRITFMFDTVSFNGSDSASIQLGDSGGIETTGYTGNIGISAGISSGNLNTLSDKVVVIFSITAAADNCSGLIHIVNASFNKWLITGQTARNGTSQIYNVLATKTLSDVLDRIRFKVDGGSSFDAGLINIMWEF